MIGGETLEDLASLMDNSLLRQAETAAGQDRLVMLETIKAYAAERLLDLPELHAATLRAHATYFADFAQQQWEELTGPRREPALNAMAADIANLRASWRYWIAAKDLVQLNKLVDSLWLFYDAQGWYHSTVQVATDLLTVLSSTPSSPGRATQEVMLRTSLARALMTIHGYTQEVEDAYGRALEGIEGQREIPQLFSGISRTGQLLHLPRRVGEGSPRSAVKYLSSPRLKTAGFDLAAGLARQDVAASRRDQAESTVPRPRSGGRGEPTAADDLRDIHRRL